MNQRVLVTAGAAGIGREIARAFAATGARVFVCDIDAAGLERLGQEIPGVLTARCDIANRAEPGGPILDRGIRSTPPPACCSEDAAVLRG